ncbi:MAG: hypothetical protein AABX66_02155 [Nanoarchaeota archaeon]
MKKGKNIFPIILSIIILIIALGVYFNLTGNAVSGPPESSQDQQSIGPSDSDVVCVRTCMSPLCLDLTDTSCTSQYSSQCLAQCNVAEQPEPADEGESCMQECVVKGCQQYDFTCQNQNKASCEEECNMIKAPDESTMSEEQKCITNCVNTHSPNTICKPSQEGEQGNDVCQMCSQQCVHLYAGPCLDKEKLEAKKTECKTCENCYGSPIMGDSGEGWECIVDIECKDATGEFGDDPGTGEGIIAQAGDTINNIASSIGNFFSNLFGGNDETPQDTQQQTDSTPTE